MAVYADKAGTVHRETCGKDGVPCPSGEHGWCPGCRADREVPVNAPQDRHDDGCPVVKPPAHCATPYGCISPHLHRPCGRVDQAARAKHLDIAQALRDMLGTMNGIDRDNVHGLDTFYASSAPHRPYWHVEAAYRMSLVALMGGDEGRAEEVADVADRDGRNIADTLGWLVTNGQDV